jgi:hypothetical protein
MQHPRYAALVLRQTLALLVDDHLLDETLVIVAKARCRRLCLGCIRGGASFFCSMMKLFIPPNLLLWSHATEGFVQQHLQVMAGEVRTCNCLLRSQRQCKPTHFGFECRYELVAAKRYRAF